MSEIRETDKRAAGATEKTKAEVEGKILEFLWHLKKNGYKEITITLHSKRLRRLIKLGADLWNPESVKEVIACQDWCENTKAICTNVYNNFAEFIGVSWKRPKYKCQSGLPFIPTEAEIDSLIASCGKKTATFLQLLKETAMRAGEAADLKWTDIDIQRRLVYVRPEKGSNPRIFKISNKLASMLSKLPRKSEKVFSSIDVLEKSLHHSRKMAAEKLGNPRLLKIHYHTLRHWKATMEYHKTKDIVHVQQLLGHKSINNTMIYIHIEQSIFGQAATDSEYTTRVASSVKGARALIEAGYEYVTDMQGYKIFRKRR